MTNGCKMMWSFFGSGHGKGPHDGARAIIKCFIRREQLSAHGRKLQNASEVVNFPRTNLSKCSKSSYVRKKKPFCRVFWHVKSDDVDHCSFSFACDNIESTKKIHCIYATNKHVLTQLLVKPLACFCALCVDNKWDECANVKWTGDWISKHFQPTNTRYVREFMNYAQDGEW